MIKRILHIDMDAFYASVEQRDRPELQGKPVIIGGSKRGVVSAASYEARRYGVRSAMPGFEARRLCPQGVFLPVRMHRYREVSRQVMALLREFSPLVEQVSIDEAFLDITGTELLLGAPETVARNIKQRVQAETGLTCSVGIAPNRFLAKIASEMHKPDGLTIVEPDQILLLLKDLAVHKVPGIGAKMAERLNLLGVRTLGEVLRFPLEFWVKRFGKSGAHLYDRALGKGSADVVAHREPKSFGAEDTFPSDTNDPEELRHWLLHQAEAVGVELRAKGYRAQTVTLKVKFSDFRVKTRSRTLPEPTCGTRCIYDCVLDLLSGLNLTDKVRLTGVSVSNLVSGLRQATFGGQGSRRQEMLDRAVDEIQHQFGKKAIQRGRQVDFEP